MSKVTVSLPSELAINYKNLDYEIETHRCHSPRSDNRPINYKNLDYEIETFHEFLQPLTYLLSINYKNLDYEIETILVLQRSLITLDDQL